MKEKLIIKNFGPIKDVELKLGRFNVLIGEQGTGKSTVAKLLIAIQSTFFRDLFDVPESQLLNRETQLFFEYLKIVEVQTYLSDESVIYHNNEIFSFQFRINNVTIEKHREPSFGEMISYNINYIPAERILVATLANSLYALIETGTSLPRLFLRFGDKFQKARKELEIYDYTNILGIKYTHKNNADIIVLESGKEINFGVSSSGIQGSVSLLTVFDSIIRPFAVKENPGKFELLNYLVIEEPELNCFPETQYKLLKHIIENIITNKNNFQDVFYKNRLLITTHSPYILSSLNNCMEAYKSGQLDREETEKIIEKKYWVNPDDVSAYMLSNGGYEDIMDREEGMIKVEKIDSVSRKLNKEFDLLLDIELGISEAKR